MAFAFTSASLGRELGQTGLTENEKVACKDSGEQGMEE